jgi:hypothetical protein
MPKITTINSDGDYTIRAAENLTEGYSVIGVEANDDAATLTVGYKSASGSFVQLSSTTFTTIGVKVDHGFLPVFSSLNFTGSLGIDQVTIGGTLYLLGTLTAVKME